MKDYTNKKISANSLDEKRQSKDEKRQSKHLQVVKNDKDIQIRNKVFQNILHSFKTNKGVKGLEMMESLLEKGHITESELVKSFSEEYGLELINDLGQYTISKDILHLIPEKICRKNLILPLVKIDKTLVVVFANPTDFNLRDNLLLMTGLQIQPVVSTPTEIKSTFNRIFDNQDAMDNLIYDMSFDLFGFDNEVAIDLDKERSNLPEDAVVGFVNLIFSDAIRLKSSDIHLESYEKAFRIRYRIDGILYEKHNLNKEMSNSIISRIKVMSGMDISEKRKPQDARLKVIVSKTELNMRVNSTPTVNGEKIVLRILDNSALEVDMTKLGMLDFQMKLFQKHLNTPQGLILMTGPTGSGKTTTIYSGLMNLNTPKTNISTAEDPVEFRIHGINQVQMNPKAGLTFSTTLRAFLRQDPDVILVGEIRDLETAEIAYKASATGHLVLSTVHTNDTASTVTRMLSMGVPSYSVADSTSLIISQRLMRKLCSNCKLPAPKNHLRDLQGIGVSKEDLIEYKNNLFIRNEEGCNQCGGVGFKGRIAIYEMMEMTKFIKEGIFEKLSPIQLKRISIEKDDLVSLRQASLLKVKEGLTSVEEALRVTVDDI